MYAETLPVSHEQPKLVATTKNHEHVQHVVVSFSTELTDSVARGLGATNALADLRSGAQTKAEFEISAVRCVLDMAANGTSCRLTGAIGVKAVAKVPTATKKNPEPVPTVTLRFDAAWTDETIAAIAHMFGHDGTVRIEKEQTSLLDGDLAPAPKKRGKKA